MNDIKGTFDGDLEINGGLSIANSRTRDRNIVLARVLTVRGEVPNSPDLGASDKNLGGLVNETTISDIERDVLRALSSDLGIRDLDPTIKILPISRNRLLVLVQPNKNYNDGQEGGSIVGDFWHRDEPMTLLNGEEG
jgi:hypothetical protein